MNLQTAQKHDAEILRSINAVLGIPDFERVIAELRDDQKWHYRDLEKFRALRALMFEEENEFASTMLRGKAQQLRLALHKLIEFSARHFFVCDRHSQGVGGEFLYRLYPRLQEKSADGDKRAQELWHGHLATLAELCGGLTRSYREFQTTGKTLAR